MRIKLPVEVQYDEYEKTPYGILMYSDGNIVYVKPYIENMDEGFRELTPIAYHSDILQFSIIGDRVFANHQQKGWLEVKFMDSVNVYMLQASIAAYAGADVSLANPVCRRGYKGWRLVFKAEMMGQPQIIGSKVVCVPSLENWADRLFAARILSLLHVKSRIIVFGEPGTGKTTVVNSILKELVKLRPYWALSVIDPNHQIVKPKNAKLWYVWTVPKSKSYGEVIGEAVASERLRVLVAEELPFRYEDIEAWFNLGRSGVVVLTTFHSPSIVELIEVMKKFLSLWLKTPARNEDVYSIVDTFLLPRSRLDQRGRYTFWLESGYITSLGRLYQLLHREPGGGYVHMDEEQFLEILREKEYYRGCIQDSALQVYEELKEKYGVDPGVYKQAEMDQLELTLKI